MSALEDAIPIEAVTMRTFSPEDRAPWAAVRLSAAGSATKIYATRENVDTITEIIDRLTEARDWVRSEGEKWHAERTAEAAVRGHVIP